MRTDFACTESVMIWPRNSPETFLKLPIVVMMYFLSVVRAAPLRPRCAWKGSRRPAPQRQPETNVKDGVSGLS
jgi:hypothetical protein